MKYSTAALFVVLWLGVPGAARAQHSPALATAQEALAECLTLVQTDESRRLSKPAFERAEKAFRAAVAAEAANPEAHTGLGETLSRCGVPHASMTNVMGVVEQSTKALEAALRLDPQHWLARFILGMNHYNMPPFLNRNGDAIREFEILRRQQGARNDAPHFTMTFLRLGNAYQRAGRRADAAAAYSTGARLFPEHAELRERAASYAPGETAEEAAIEPQITAAFCGWSHPAHTYAGVESGGADRC